ncbi:MAG: DegT/DnrJ/EryC1/StrS family aminotransferase [Alphaproteobacteria bacterium]
MSSLALLGGDAVRQEPFPAYRTIGETEKVAVTRVLESGILSRFLGTWHPDFYGGPEVQAFEREWAALYAARHAVAVNSCTSGLFAAVGAVGCGPGDEVICSPYTMSASATAALIFNAVPVFADIDRDTYNISAETIRPRITQRTKAIIVVHIFGQPADMDPIMELAKEHGLFVIEDCAQAPFARYKGRLVGSLGHVGAFSLNYHKHIHSGEGGMLTTNDDDLAERLQLIRNHAEAVVEKKGVTNLVNMIGFNFRLGEIEAAIGRCQIDKGEALVRERQHNVRYLEEQLAGLPGLSLPKVGPAEDHVYYVHALGYDVLETGVPRETIVQALKAELPVTELREAEGPLVGMGYVKPLYLMPMYQEQVGYGAVQCPFRCPHYTGEAQYGRGLCPNAEEAHFERVIIHELMRPPMSRADLDDVTAAFHKVFGNLDVLRDHAQATSREAAHPG